MTTDRSTERRINDRIRASEVRVIGPEGQQLGVLDTPKAVAMARDEYDLDLVEVAPDANPPVCRVMDYSKFRYQESIRVREARRRGGASALKSVQLGPKTHEHDYEVKRKQLEKFLAEGHRVRVSVFYRRRWELARPELGRRLLQRLAADVGELAKIEAPVKHEGRTISMVLAPARKAPR